MSKDTPSSKPAPQGDSKAIPQHKRMAMGKPIPQGSGSTCKP
jgi:hypothetical protein